MLLQQGQYSENELRKIKRHTTIGAELLSNSNSPLLQAAETVALNHHERWDGSGYPHGITEDQIPLSARMCAIADVFDALTTPRPYKKEISAEDASRLIIGAGGTLFDPQLTQVFEDELQAILKVRKSAISTKFHQKLKVNHGVGVAVCSPVDRLVTRYQLVTWLKRSAGSRIGPMLTP